MQIYFLTISDRRGAGLGEVGAGAGEGAGGGGGGAGGARGGQTAVDSKSVVK